MKKTFGKLSLVCAAVLAAFALASCSGGDSVAATPRNTTHSGGGNTTPRNNTNNDNTATETPPVVIPAITLTTAFEGDMSGFALAGSGTATINWGDGSPEQSVELQTLVLDNYGQIAASHHVPHTYAEGSGTKTIKVTGTITGMDSGNTASVTSVDVTTMSSLKYLDLYDEKLTALNVTKNTALTWLRCPFNAITSLDLSKNSALSRLTCQNNALTRLDVSKNVALTELLCNNNAITALDVSKNTALVEFICSDNALTRLDVSGMLFLKTLACHENRLTSLNVSGCTALETLGCNWNKLSANELKVVFSQLSNRTDKSPAGRMMCGAADLTEVTATMTQNPGWASLTDSDKKVAIDKNWEVE